METESKMGSSRIDPARQLELRMVHSTSNVWDFNKKKTCLSHTIVVDGEKKKIWFNLHRQPERHQTNEQRRPKEKSSLVAVLSRFARQVIVVLAMDIRVTNY